MSTLFADIEGQNQVVAYLERVLDTDSATHAYLIAGGTAGQGAAIAERFAAGLLAENDAASQTTHPDLHIYTPGGADGYLVEQIRELTHDAELAPIRAPRKVYIVNDAHRLSGAPANAFLKMLEEPPQNVVCILVANTESAVLETLRSRCEVLVLNATQTQQAGNAELFDMLFSLARGCNNRTLLANSKRMVELTKEQAAAIDTGALDAQAYIEKYDEFLSQGAKKQIEQQGKREVTAHERAALFAFTDMARTWLRDCLITLEGETNLLAYPNQAAQTARIAQTATPANILTALDAVKSTATRISYNVTPQLAIDAMFLEIREALCHR